MLIVVESNYSVEATSFDGLIFAQHLSQEKLAFPEFVGRDGLAHDLSIDKNNILDYFAKFENQ